MIKLFDPAERRRKKFRSIKFIASDLDGTLLRSDNSISEKTLINIAEMRSFGVELILLSGRTDTFMRTYTALFNSTMPVVSLSGSLIKSANGDLLYGSFIPENAASMICEIGGKYPDMTIAAFTPDGIFYETADIFLPKYLRARIEEQHQSKTLTSFYNKTVLFVATGPYAAVQEIVRNTAKSFQNKLVRIFYQTKMGIDRYYLEIKNSGVTKGTALEFLSSYLNVKPKAFAAIGDFDNDIEMCRFAGVSAALRNAVDALKDEADIVTRNTNDEDGAAEFFQLIIDTCRNAQSG